MSEHLSPTDNHVLDAAFYCKSSGVDVPKTRWTSERIARLGFLIGLGWEAKRVAEDPLIVSTANNVHRQAQRFGLAFRAVPASPMKLTPEALSCYDAAAARRGVTREALMRMLLTVISEDASLIDNILDDDAPVLA